MESQHLQSVLAVLRQAVITSEITVSRNKYDFLADRLRVATTEPTLLGCINRYFDVVGGKISAVNDEMLQGLLTACASPDAGALLALLIDQPRIIMGMVKSREDAMITDFVAAYRPRDITTATLQQRASFDIPLRAVISSALSHADDTKAGNVTLFRRGDVKGGLRLPFYSGNALGGQMRDLLADHLLTALGISLDRAEPKMDTWFFHLLYSGGIMADGAIPKSFERRLCGAAAGSVQTNGVRELRTMLPFFSMLGGVGKSPLEGYVYINDLRPCCQEWGNGDTPAAELMTWRFMARRDDLESRVSKAQVKAAKTDDALFDNDNTDAPSDDRANTSMLVNTECLREGVELEGGIDMSAHMTAIERAALGRGLLLLQEAKYLGGKKHRGYGRVAWTMTNVPDPTPYDTFLQERKQDILRYLQEIGANIKGHDTCTALI